MKSSPLGCRGFAVWLVSVCMTLLAGGALAQQPITPRSVAPALDGLKKSYEVKNFRIGGRYDLMNPKAWENGGDGGTTLESLAGC